jgi:L-ascorbate metabolism protein UlaG (beta-lactamase superfamily)
MDRFNRKRKESSAVAICASAVLLLSLGSCTSMMPPGHDGPFSDHFDGSRFYNPIDGRTERDFGDFLRWQLTGERGPWPDRVEIESYPAPPARAGEGRCRVTFVNHATVLVQMDGLNVLTDPIWSERASPFSWIGPKRVHDPGVAFEDLPPIDVVLISHNHYDHLDLDTIGRLEEVHSPAFYTGLGNGALLRSAGAGMVSEMDWGDVAWIGNGAYVAFLPCRHWSCRGPGSMNTSLWGAFAFRGPSGGVYFAGDTGYGPHFVEAELQHGPFDVAFLPIGSYLPRWFMGDVHMTPAEAVRAHEDLRAARTVPVHFGTFPLADDGYDRPLDELREALKGFAHPEKAFWVLKPGEGRDVPVLGIDRLPAAYVP